MPESATEWMDSASIDDEPVSRKATNLVTAMPRFAISAAMIALLPPDGAHAAPRPPAAVPLSTSIGSIGVGSTPWRRAR